MHGLCTSTGRLLRSVALRYRRPMCPPGVHPAVGGGIDRLLLPGEPAEDFAGSDGPHARSGGLTRLEAVLFLADQPLASRKLAQLAGLTDGTKARTLVRTLNRLYDAEGSAFRVEEVAGGFQLMSRSKFAPWLRRLHNGPIEIRLSAPAMETLAVVAYRQPVLRADVEAIRGVQCGEILRQLIERDLVRIAGRSEELGRPFLYGTTREFLQVFGLRHLDELPRGALLRAAEPAPENTGAVPTDTGQGEEEMPNQSHPICEAEEEKNVKTLTPIQAALNEPLNEGAAAPIQPEKNEQPANDLPFDDLDDDPDEDEYEDEDDDEDEDDYDEGDDDEDEDDGFEDEPWEEVGDDEEKKEEEEKEEEEEEEEYDDEWDEDEEWEEDGFDDKDEKDA